MENEDIYSLFREQKEYFKFSEFLENCITWEYEDETDLGVPYRECGEGDSNTRTGGDQLILNINNS